MAKKEYDFSGWATKFGIKCSDGVTIAPKSFSENDGKEVPLIWNHDHKDMKMVVGHALLEQRDEGVYAYGKFNNTEEGVRAKELVRNGDITAMSIWAHQLKKSAGNIVTHGLIRELSLVLAGANPGACVVEPIRHDDAETNYDDFEADIYNDDHTIIFHSDDIEEEDAEQEDSEETLEHAEENNTETLNDIINGMNEKQRLAAMVIIANSLKQSGVEPDDDALEAMAAIEQAISEDTEFTDNESINDIYETMSDKQKATIELIIGYTLPEEQEIQHSEDENTDDNLQHNEEETLMKQNVFDNQELNNNDKEFTLSHSDIQNILETAKTNGSLKEAAKGYVISHAAAGTVTDIDKLFPEAQLIGEKPAVIKNDTSWVASVMAGVKKSPFAKVKTIAVDITSENARAKGYVKGNQKTDDVMLALKRSHDPQTVYVKTKMDRDDILDITDFDIVQFKKAEMRDKLDEEIARAVLTGDGRSVDSPDKIFPAHIQPILGDSATYVTANVAELITDADADVQSQKNAKAYIKKVRRSRRDYKGSGKPVMYMDSVLLDELLLIEDKNERFIYESEEELAKVLRVSKIIPVEYFGTVTRTADGKIYTLQSIMVNLTDYTIGANKGGAVALFDDFDINFNQQLYLIETRCSGALTKPFSAVTYETYVTASSTPSQE